MSTQIEFKKTDFGSRALPKLWDVISQITDDKKYTIEIRELREKRSLDANAYLWVLIGKIADAIKSSKDEVYLTMLKRYGQGGIVKLRNKDVDEFRRAYKYCEEHERLPDEDAAKYLRFWIGSSKYDQYEMSVLIDGVVSECQQLGIETRTPEELERLVSLWGSQN